MRNKMPQNAWKEAIPPKFARLWGKLLDQITHLEDSDGRRWGVKVSEADGCRALQQGWEKFVSEHSIVVGEFLVFTYAGKSIFTVQIFGISGCDRRAFPRGSNMIDSAASRFSRRRRPAANNSLTPHGNGRKSKCSAVVRSGEPEDSSRRASYKAIVPARERACTMVVSCIVISDDEGKKEDSESEPHEHGRKEVAAEKSKSSCVKTKSCAIVRENYTAGASRPRRKQRRGSAGEMKDKADADKVPRSKKKKAKTSHSPTDNPVDLEAGDIRDFHKKLGPGIFLGESPISIFCNLDGTAAAESATACVLLPSLTRTRKDEEIQWVSDNDMHIFLVDVDGTCHVARNPAFHPLSFVKPLGSSQHDGDA